MRAVLITAIFALAAVGQATGAELNRASSAPESLYQEHSRAGETADTFILRIAPRAVSYTNRTGHQVCGAVVQNPDGRYTIEMRTIGQGYRCEIPAEAQLYFVTHIWSAGTFSRAEREVPGYMATRNSLYHQDGRSERKVGTLRLW
ncbi:hypothetical protein [Stenotrophomonas bentonitica]|uniref:hypothetical protein n=1 Tax=Stenotrophomonas bentonitica TaxID=1450134 RepID=UPI00345E7480